MSTIQIQKFVGAFLAAMLLALGVNFIAQVIYGAGAHGGEGEPVYLVGGAGPAVAEGEPAPTKSVIEAFKREGREARAEAEAPTEAGAGAVSVEVGVGATVAEPSAAAEEPAAAPVAVAAADPEAGKKVFRKCTACHNDSADGKHKIGPNLWGVVGAAVARHADFKYSGALSDLGGSWDKARLDEFLADPKGFAPGTKMAFPGLADAADRAAVIAYLGTLGG